LTIASRLAEDASTTILVIEAGPNAQNDSLINDPGQSYPVTAVYNWGYNTTTQVGGNILNITQGKVLGGSSSINGMCWTRGTIDQYNSLETLGNPGWNFNTLMSYMKKAERYHLPNDEQVALGATADPAAHGYDGNVNAGFPQPYEATVSAEKLEEAFQAAIPGLLTNIDVASGIPNGVARFQFSIKPGNNTVITPDGNVRASSPNSFIYPFLQEQPNLTILTGHYATTIVWGDRVGQLLQAAGVRFISTPTSEPGNWPNPASPEFQVGASREVIVSLGALGVDLPAVGTNLQDQAMNINLFTVPSGIPTSEYTIVNAPVSPVVAFLDLAQVLGDDSAREAGLELLSSVSSRAKDIVAAGGFTSESGMVKMLQVQANSIANLNVDPRYHTGSPLDLYLKGNVTRTARAVFQTSPLSDFVADEIVPGLAVLPQNATDATIQAYVLGSYVSAIHPIGSVSMLPREDGGAVGPDLIVYGTKNVRVVGALLLSLAVKPVIATYPSLCV
ncbi:hypothetical protein H0H92_009855, partial [Tricholoma furcatifolium]